MLRGVGATVSVGDDAFVALFSESAARALVTVRPDDLGALEELAGSLGVPLTRLGETGGDALTVDAVLSIPIAELRETWSRTLPEALGG